MGGTFGRHAKGVTVLGTLVLAFALFACTSDGAPSSADEEETPDLVPTCTDSCESLGYVCGEVCGQSCGSCDESAACVLGSCRCTPTCDASAGGKDDGCGGICPSAADFSCLDCGLKLVQVARELGDEGLSAVTLAVEVKSEAGKEPRLADLRIAADQPVTLERVQATDVLGDAQKVLHRYVGTNLPFEQLADGTFRLVVESADVAHKPIGSGRWLTLRFRTTQKSARSDVRFRLVRREQTFAPLAADGPLQASAYDTPLTIRATR